MIILKEGNLLFIGKDSEILSCILLKVHENEIMFYVHLLLYHTLSLQPTALPVFLQSLLRLSWH